MMDERTPFAESLRGTRGNDTDEPTIITTFQAEAEVDGKPALSIEQLIEVLGIREDGRVLRQLQIFDLPNGRRFVLAEDVSALCHRLGIPRFERGKQSMI
jgi:hypothetical protein